MSEDQKELSEDEINLHLGKRLRRRRRLLGMTQTELSFEVGVKFQQIVKYETAYNNVSVGRLYRLSKALNVQPSFFFEDASWSRPDSIRYDAPFSKLISITDAYNKVSGAEHQGNIDVNKHIGRRLKALRLLQGLTQENLGKPLGITFQQIQKYESGINKITAGRLFRIANALKVSSDFFFEGLPGMESKVDIDLGASMNTLCEHYKWALETGNKKTIETSRQKIMAVIHPTFESK